METEDGETSESKGDEMNRNAEGYITMSLQFVMMSGGSTYGIQLSTVMQK